MLLAPIRSYLLIDPDTETLEWVNTSLNLEILCDLLRCDATELIELIGPLVGYIDGEGHWQGRQTLWEFNGQPIFGPMLVGNGSDDFGIPLSCSPEDKEILEPHIRFLPPLPQPPTG